MRSEELTGQLWDVIRGHIDAEDAQDVFRTLATITDDCHYEFPFEGLEIDGVDALTPYYSALFQGHWPGSLVEKQFPRWWQVGEDTIFYESLSTFDTSEGLWSGRSAAALTVREGRLSQEIILLSTRSPWTHNHARKRSVQRHREALNVNASLLEPVMLHLRAFASHDQALLASTVEPGFVWESPFLGMAGTTCDLNEAAFREIVPKAVTEISVTRCWQAESGELLIEWIGVEDNEPCSPNETRWSVLDIGPRGVRRHVEYSVARKWATRDEELPS